jgi:hypothetical protein
MGVPETAVDKYNFAPRWKDKIGAPWQVFLVKSKTVTKAMYEPADAKLRLRIFASNPSHALAALGRRHRVHRFRSTAPFANGPRGSGSSCILHIIPILKFVAYSLPKLNIPERHCHWIELDGPVRASVATSGAHRSGPKCTVADRRVARHSS